MIGMGDKYSYDQCIVAALNLQLGIVAVDTIEALSRRQR